MNTRRRFYGEKNSIHKMIDKNKKIFCLLPIIIIFRLVDLTATVKQQSNVIYYRLQQYSFITISIKHLNLTP